MRFIINFRNKIFFIHPALFGISPIIFLYSHNIDQMYFHDILLPSGIVLTVTLLSLLFLGILLLNYMKASIIVSIIWILFFSYGHFLEMIKDIKTADFIFGVEGNLLFLYGAFFIFSTFLTIRTRKDLYKYTAILNVMVLSLVFLSFINIIIYNINTTGIKQTNILNIPNNRYGSVDPIKIRTMPDIYYIILDGYANSTTLKEVYGFNNDDFTDYLEEKGFFVACKSRSNYSMTTLSLASSLNMEYVNYLSRKAGLKSKNLKPLLQMIENNNVMQYLKSRGYKIIHFRSGVITTNKNKNADMDIDCGMLDEFLIVLIKTTILSPFAKGLGFFALARLRVLNTFSKIAEVAKIEYPTFTFAHILSPHPPYLFDNNGLPVQKSELKLHGYVWNDKLHYLKQLVFVNMKIKELVNNILSYSHTAPVIILQADHGTASLFDAPGKGNWNKPTEAMLIERIRIFNAYLLPQNGSLKLYNSITPVNSFRLIFNVYFEAAYELLGDRCYYSSYVNPYKLTDVTGIVKF